MKKLFQSFDDMVPTSGNSGGMFLAPEVVGRRALQMHDRGVLWNGCLITFYEMEQLRARARAELNEMGIYVGG